MNMGQLATLLRDKLGVETIQFNKVAGQPCAINAIMVSDSDHVELCLLFNVGQNCADALIPIAESAVHV